MVINKEILKKITNKTYYDGNIIHQPFAYKFFRDNVSPSGDIICFRAPMQVETEGMIDLEDLLQQDFIYSDDAINIIWEIPHLDSFGAVCFQRLFNAQIANILFDFIKKPVEIDGDDILVHDEFTSPDGRTNKVGKASVSIAYSKNNIAMSHTAININAGTKAPSFAYSTKLTDEQIDSFMVRVVDCFYNIVSDISIATRKLTIN